jgi:cyclic pyranopterin phosphate synthase
MSLSHVNNAGEAHMVDVAAKPATSRVARAEGLVVMQPSTLAAILAGNMKKGDVLGCARIAGIMAAKRTHDLIPLCHPLALSHVAIALVPDEALPGIRVAGGR